jgi:predicted dehydrogenase
VLNVLIIGCGNIAGRFDEGGTPSSLPLTHAGAFRAHGGFKLAACVEPDQSRRSEFMLRWSVEHGYESPEALRQHVGAFDVISICSPTAMHAAHLDVAVSLRPRLIFCEKPVTPSVNESEYWSSKCAAAGILLAVNHTRRWAPDVRRLGNELRAGEWGTLRSVIGHYNKGVMNNGGHMIDLLRMLVGEMSICTVGRAVWDFWKDDPSVPATLISEDGVPICLNATHAADYSCFELELFTSTAVLVMESGGGQWRVRRAADSPTFKGYRSLGASETRAGEYSQAMSNAVANIADAILCGAPLASTGESALRAQRICQQLRVAAATQQPFSTASSGNPS